MEIELYPQSLALSGNLEVKLQKTYQQIAHGNNKAILIVQFSGDHGYGSGGNNNSAFMRTVIAAAMGLNLFDGFILDLTQLEYSFGDSIYSVIELPVKIKNNNLPYYIVVSKKCENAIRSLLKFEQVESVFMLENDLYSSIQKIYKLFDNT